MQSMLNCSLPVCANICEYLTLIYTCVINHDFISFKYLFLILYIIQFFCQDNTPVMNDKKRKIRESSTFKKFTIPLLDNVCVRPYTLNNL